MSGQFFEARMVPQVDFEKAFGVKTCVIALWEGVNETKNESERLGISTGTFQSTPVIFAGRAVAPTATSQEGHYWFWNMHFK